ncbi:flagellar hook-associated protein 3 FlgL [Vagococcus fluvialis]|uniref:Flagellin n=1 Tax=Vagococcus fluvialis TaxID=2738 RepID=A0A369AST2_9ENTE|nr:flagellin [Vagococcus fluvialis]RCX12291.1 flagellar hook-associated protein 3 FlgL [Vagococcus fluvialis]RSU00791.1 flagellin [Vagococcus fluvialis]
MRVSNSTIYTEFNRNMANNLNRLRKYQDQLNSFSEYSKSSDNPLVYAKIINMNDSIVQNEYYNSTIADSMAWGKTQDSALESATDSLHRIRQLIESSATGTQGNSELQANKKEIMSEIEGIVDSLNTNFDGRYIFGGKNTKTPPFEIVKDDKGDIVEVKYNGTKDKVNPDGTVTSQDGNLPRVIATGVTVDLISDGRLFMKEEGTADNPENLSTFFSDVIKAINSDDKDKLSNELLAKVDVHTENFVNIRSRIGTVTNRFEAAKDRNENETINLKEALSEKQDVDVVQKYMEFANQMVAYQASLSMGTKIMQTSILDYV